MVRSMTGYGKAIVEIAEQTISVEMRSINHRFLDITFKMPRYLFSLEDEMKRLIKQQFNRGKIEVYIHLHGQDHTDKNLQVDWNLLEQYVQRLKEIKKTHQLKGEVAIESLLKIPDLFNIEEQEELNPDLQEACLQALKLAMQEANHMRKQEGTFLLEDLGQRLQNIGQIVKQIEGLQPLVEADYKERIEKRIKNYLEDASQIDEIRLHQEIGMLIEKGDITEELVRLNSHVQQMEKTLEESGSIGRKLDFISQEMHREANTIGSKSTDSRLSELNLLLKSENEKIKEQIQNLE